jgi:excinuclease ABC subunit C
LTGVYIYFDIHRKPIYVGKAKNLKNRLNSYLNIKLERKTSKLMEETKYFSTIQVSSELESLLLEASLVKKYKPKYNIELKDDKNPLYIKITKDVYPMIKTARRIEQKQASMSMNIFGPFPSSANVKFVLKYIRKVIPYADHLPGKKPCIYSQIGLCDPCPSTIELKDKQNIRQELKDKYRDNIRIIRKILNGKTSELYGLIKKEMYKASKVEDFEKSSLYRNILNRLDYISQPINHINSYVENPNFLYEVRSREITELKRLLLPYLQVKSLERIECFDIAHLMGQNPTASMVTFINGVEEKKYYRKFKINQKKSDSDVDSMSEVAERRFKHLSDWGRPDLIVVDGGRSQVTIFKDVMDMANINVVGIAKRFETLVIKIEGGHFIEIRPRGSALMLLQRLRNEAHRFARVYHHNLVTKTLLGR